MRNFKAFKLFTDWFSVIWNLQFFGIIFFTLLILLFGRESTDAQTVIELNPAITHQTITGWEALTYAVDWPGHSLAYPTYMNELLDITVNEVGISRVRVEIGSGTENTEDCWAKFENSEYTEGEFKACRYTPVNDNTDPNVINPNGFYFSELDHEFDDFVVPLKQRLAAIGEDLHVNLCYVDFGSSTFEHYNNPEEYAEFVLATYRHLQNKYGFVPDTWEIILEPDNSSWQGKHIGNCIVAAANRLKMHGFTPRFVAPSCTSMFNAVAYFDQIIQVPDAVKYLEEISYHRYAHVSDANLETIASRAVQYGIKAAMLEHLGSSYENLHKDLKMGRNSAWSGAYSIAGKNPAYDLYTLDDSDPLNPLVTITNHAKFYRQYFKFIRPGAVRIDATSNNSNFDPLAFINQSGKHVVVVKASSSGSLSIQGLPNGTYGIKYTTASQYDVDLSDQYISQGEVLTTSIPAAGVITIYANSLLRLSEIIGTWDNGIRYWDVAAASWTEMISYTSSGDIAAGDFSGDGKADVASIWSDGLWYQDGATLAWIKVDNSPPYSVTAGDVTGDGRFEIIGTWNNGIWYWDFVASTWTQMTSESTTGDIAAGDFTGDGKADVASTWEGYGLWYQDGATLAWIKVDNSPPYSVTAGDVTGDGRFEIIGTWNNGIWYWDFVASTWTQMTSESTTGDIAAGDFTGDGKADVASSWDNGLWYQDGATLAWTKLDSSPAFSVTAGDVTGN